MGFHLLLYVIVSCCCLLVAIQHLLLFPYYLLFTPCSLIVQLSQDYLPIIINNLYHRYIIQFLCHCENRLHLGIIQNNLILLSVCTVFAAT